MAIICNILRFLGKEFLDGSLIQKRSAQNSQHFVRTPVQLEVVLNDSHHAICSDGRIYLDSDSSLSCAPEGLDFKMLLDPFKEQFHMPTIFVKESYLSSVHRALVMHLRLGDVDERRNIRFNLVKRMHLDACFCPTVIDFVACKKQEFCPPEDAQAKIDSCRIEGIHLPVYLKVFVDPLLSRKVYHMIGKFFKDARLASLVGLGEIVSRYVLAKAKMIALPGVCLMSHSLKILLNTFIFIFYSN